MELDCLDTTEKYHGAWEQGSSEVRMQEGEWGVQEESCAGGGAGKED